jgi:hypothetical protein
VGRSPRVIWNPPSRQFAGRCTERRYHAYSRTTMCRVYSPTRVFLDRLRRFLAASLARNTAALQGEQRSTLAVVASNSMPQRGHALTRLAAVAR